MSDFFFLVAVSFIAVAVLQSFFTHSRSSQRRVYWSCVSFAAIAGFLSAYPNYFEGLGIVAFVAVAMTVAAYAYTPYIKVNGKVYTLAVHDKEPEDENSPGSRGADVEQDPAPDAYSGLVSPTKMWWMVVGILVISAGNVFAFLFSDGEGWVAAIVLPFLVGLPVVTGLGDASWGYRIARGQMVQFVIAGLITLGTFTVLYLGAYAAGKRWPLRRATSMEYRAHPHLRNKYRL